VALLYLSINKRKGEGMIPLKNDDQSNGMKIGLGVFAKKVKILTVQNKCNIPGKPSVTIGNNGFEPELCLIVTYEIAEDWTKDLYLFGKYKRDKQTGKIKGWDSWNNDVQRFIMEVNPEMAAINDDLSIPENLIKSFAGKEMTIVTYISDRGYTTKNGEQRDFSYNDWSKVFGVDVDKQEIQKLWNDSLQYVKDYFPDKAKELEDDKAKEEEAFDPAQMPANEDVI
jgi:hypothetical protein